MESLSRISGVLTKRPVMICNYDKRQVTSLNLLDFIPLDVATAISVQHLEGRPDGILLLFRGFELSHVLQKPVVVKVSFHGDTHSVPVTLWTL